MENTLIHRDKFRKDISMFEQGVRSLPYSVEGKELDKMCPLKHTFVDGMYVREIFMPKDIVLVTKIHKIRHPFFILEGEVTVVDENGSVRIKAPHHGITVPGTKRALHVHEDCVWITVHANPTDTQDLKMIEDGLIAKTFDELPDSTIKKEMIS